MTIEVTQLIVCRGLMGSGKSTWAKEWVAKDVRHRARVERDQLRIMMHDGVWKGSHTEKQVVAGQKALVKTLLSTGISVVVSDTSLDVATFNAWRDLAASLRYDHEIVFKMQDFRDVPLEVCLQRNALRTGKARVPDKAIVDAYNKHIKGA